MTRGPFVDPVCGMSVAAEGPSDAIYTCPMHPEIRKQGPGSCPICGMALEPLEVSLDVIANALRLRRAKL